MVEKDALTMKVYPSKLKYTLLEVDVVVLPTENFLSQKLTYGYLNAVAKIVILSSPTTDGYVHFRNGG